MNISESHSWVTHSLPKRSLEKISVRGICFVSTRYCPVLRCHQKSGSVIGRTLAAKITSMKIKSRSRRLERSMSTKPPCACSRIPTGENSILADCLMLHTNDRASTDLRYPRAAIALDKGCGRQLARPRHVRTSGPDWTNQHSRLREQ